ncbi:hypothetical protein K438DRAFT_1756721 [Mycena galopus ATCC 62051]|nr:hypothetical protein K438DRAFT_1756721 [Mycena galopus ATCC 62051]
MNGAFERPFIGNIFSNEELEQSHNELIHNRAGIRVVIRSQEFESGRRSIYTGTNLRERHIARRHLEGNPDNKNIQKEQSNDGEQPLNSSELQVCATQVPVAILTQIQGVKKIVESLRGQIPSINGKMVRSVRPETAVVKQLETAAEPKKSKKFKSKPRSEPEDKPPATSDSPILGSATLIFESPSSDVYACSKKLWRMYLRREWEGNEIRGYYPLLALKSTTYEGVLWVDVSQGKDRHMTFEMLQMQTRFGSKEAAWSLWKMLKQAYHVTRAQPYLITEYLRMLAMDNTTWFGGIDPILVSRGQKRSATHV